jgi:hypothetical protein
VPASATGADWALAHWQAAAKTMVTKGLTEFIHILLSLTVFR